MQKSAITQKPVSMQNNDQRFMAAALRLGRWHNGLTGTNPSVATLLVDETKSTPRIIGRGVTAIGGRPHAERIAVDEAGKFAKGATAYVTLEPCAHHGMTPPCAQVLIDAGIAKIVTAYQDPDVRVDGEGHKLLRKAGIEVVSGVLNHQAQYELHGYLTRKRHNRPSVHLKLAMSKDGKIGVQGKEMTITGTQSRAQVHMMRAQCDAVLIGAGTLRSDDPELTCRLPGLENRSPIRVVLAGEEKISTKYQIFQTARQTPTLLVGLPMEKKVDRQAFEQLGVDILGAEATDGEVPWPELLEDLSQRGISNLLVEGGAAIADSLMGTQFVDRISLFCSALDIEGNAVFSPVSVGQLLNDHRFAINAQAVYDQDEFIEFVRI